MWVTSRDGQEWRDQAQTLELAEIHYSQLSTGKCLVGKKKRYRKSTISYGGVTTALRARNRNYHVTLKMADGVEPPPFDNDDEVKDEDDLFSDAKEVNSLKSLYE